MTTASAPNLGVVEAIRAAPADPAVGDPERAAAQRAYMKSPMPFRGISKPELTAILRPLLRDPTLAPTTPEEWSDAVRGLWDHATHREQWYAALAVAD